MTTAASTDIDALTPARSRRRHIGGLDGIRALAAGLVVLFHYHQLQPVALPQPLQLFAETGWVGVDIFFAVSGFILFLPWARAAYTGRVVDWRRFARNRVLRILPAYWFNLLILVTISAGSLLLTVEGLWRVALNALFLDGYLPPGQRQPINGVAWTLFIEVGFYITLPLIAHAFVRNRWLLAFPVTLAISAGWTALAVELFASPETHKLVQGAHNMLPGTISEFAAGMSMAAVWVRLEHRDVLIPPSVAAALTGAGFAGIWTCMAVLQYEVGPSAYWYGSGSLGWLPLMTLRPLAAISAAVFIFGVCYRHNLSTTLFELRPIAYLGVISYGIYLWHLPLGRWLDAGLPDTPSRRGLLLLAVAGTALTIAWSALSHRFVERPFLQRKAVAER